MVRADALHARAIAFLISHSPPRFCSTYSTAYVPTKVPLQYMSVLVLGYDTSNDRDDVILRSRECRISKDEYGLPCSRHIDYLDVLFGIHYALISFLSGIIGTLGTQPDHHILHPKLQKLVSSLLPGCQITKLLSSAARHHC